MKKFYSTLLVALLLSISAIANSVIVKGYITSSNGSAIANKAVWIMADSLSSPTVCQQSHVVYTNANGFYIDTLSCNGGDITKVRIMTEGCNGNFLVENPTVNTATNVIERNFTLACAAVCNANFNFNISGFTVNFLSTSTTTGGGTISYIWKFGDGTSGSAANPVHSYTSPGTYNVMLIINTPNCSDSVIKAITLTATNNCDAFFSDSMLASNKFIFNSSNSVAGTGGTIIQRIWSFGDGTGITGNNIVTDHIYQQSGTYNVCLRILSSNGCVDSVCKTINVTVPASCNANFAFGVLPTNSRHIQFQNLSTAGQYTWSYGDGTTGTFQSSISDHVYPGPGTYQACLKVVAANGCQDSICKTIIIADSSCHANFNYNVGTGGVVYFNNSSSATSSSQFLWIMGSFGTSTAVNPVYTLPPGTHNVCLVMSSASCSDTLCKTIVIPPAPSNCEALFQYTGLPASPTVNGYTLQFNSSASHATSALLDSIYERIWIWGDGTTTGGKVVSPSHTYTSPSVYNVCLVIRSASGCSDTTCKTITVPMPNQLVCQSKFTYEHLPSTSANGKTVKFNSSTSAAGYGDSIVSRKWIFGDGTSITTGNTISPVHVYAQTGTYNVCLTITTALGCTKTECKIVVVPDVAGACVPHFTWVRSGSKQVTFNSSTSWVPANDSIIERKWQFGDATSLNGNVISPVHNYGFNGIYTVSLKIRTALNCEKTFYSVVPIQDSVNNNPNQDRIRIVSLYPTPAHYQMQAVVWSLQNNIQAELAIYDIYGVKKWSTNKVLFSGNNITVVPTANLASGPYYFRVTTIFGVKSRPFFKQ